MAETIIENNMKMVEEDDIIFYLGDLTIKRNRTYIELMKTIFNEMPGYKILIKGNHDYFKDKDYLEMGFKRIYKKLETKQVILIHDPNEVGNGKKLVIHGHTHNTDHRGNFCNKRFINVSVDVTGYKPVSMNDIITIFEGRKNERG